MNLGVFFTRGVGLGLWLRDGLLSRELLLYQSLVPREVNTTLFAYDRHRDPHLLSALGPLAWHPIQESWFSGRLHRFRPGRYHLFQKIRNMDLLKTNQFLGATEAVSASKATGVPLIARCGYIPSRLAHWQQDPPALQKAYLQEEHQLLKHASAVIVTTSSMADYLFDHHPVQQNQIHVIGNYLPDYFKPLPRVPNTPTQPFRVLTVGRHHPVKQYHLLIQALVPLKNVFWHAVGTGPLQAVAKKQAEASKLNTCFEPIIANSALPDVYRTADVFVLCSRREGHPKSLLEAMACGCACIVTNTPGVADDVVHEKTGLIVPPTPTALQNAILRLQQDPELRIRLGRQAAKIIRSRYALESVADQEYNVYQTLLAEGH